MVESTVVFLLFVMRVYLCYFLLHLDDKSPTYKYSLLMVSCEC